MIDRETFRLQLERHEGRRLFPYVDTVGKVTIGCGRNLTDCGIRDTEADLMLDNDITECLAELDVRLPWSERLDEVRQRVLADMMFNLGWSRLSRFTRTLTAIERGEYGTAATQMLTSLWARQVGQRAQRLAAMMATGKEQP